MNLQQIGRQAQQAAQVVSQATTPEKNYVLTEMAVALETAIPTILTANEQDVARASAQGTSEPLLDRLRLSTARITDMAAGLRSIAQLPDPIGEVDQMWKNEDGLTIGKRRVPLGVVGIIYEARPNVTTDAAGLCFKAGNAVILRGGKEALETNQAIITVLQETLQLANWPKETIQFITDPSHAVAQEFMQLREFIDVLIPRGGKKLIDTVVQSATIPVIETGTGNCHIYVDKTAQLDMAVDICVNAKCQRPSVCNAAETFLVHEDVAAEFLPALAEKLAPYHVEIRGDQGVCALLSEAVPATEADWATEFLDFIVAIKLVSSIDEAIAHINCYNTKHSEAIVTDDYFAQQKFLNQVDAAAVYVNASTRFTDGFVYGFGAEIGISTQKLHARGPMGLRELTTTKYTVYGSGQVRP